MMLLRVLINEGLGGNAGGEGWREGVGLDFSVPGLMSDRLLLHAGMGRVGEHGMVTVRREQPIRFWVGAS